MRPAETINGLLQRLDGKDYGAYQSLKGQFQFPSFHLFIDQIPKDPYAPPYTGIYRVRVYREISPFPGDTYSSLTRRTALGDYLARQFHRHCLHHSQSQRGTGHSGLITIAPPGQAILKRTSLEISPQYIEARFFMGLPARGRKICADIARKMFFDELPAIVDDSLQWKNIDEKALYRHLETADDADALRSQISASGLIAFVADNACLPRASGIDERPLESKQVIPFQSPPSLRTTIHVPNAGNITGMGIPRGVTLIVGGGYHGKSTLLRALELGIYNHVPADGREMCVADPDTVKIRASSGRNVVKTDISSFISDLPQKKDTHAFTTANASGSTSQAATIQEAIEAGARVLLLDEDTCAANFMIRDKRMQELVKKEDEPITPFIDQVRNLYDHQGISTVLVMGGSGDYFDMADQVIQMKDFTPHEVTERAKIIVNQFPTGRKMEGQDKFQAPLPRIPLSASLDPYNKYRKFKISASSPDKILFGKETIDLGDVEQILETAQAKGIGLALHHAKKFMDGQMTIKQVIEKVMAEIEETGLDLLDKRLTGDIAQFRGLELAAALNRMRQFKVQ